MPFTGEEKKAYQREYMRRIRLGLTGLTGNEADVATLNQQVQGSRPWRLSTNQPKNSTLTEHSKVILLTKFLNSRRQSIYPQTIRFYRTCLTPYLREYPLKTQGINDFLTNLKCGNAKHAYYRAIRAFCNWASRDNLIKFTFKKSPGIVNHNALNRLF